MIKLWAHVLFVWPKDTGVKSTIDFELLEFLYLDYSKQLKVGLENKLIAKDDFDDCYPI